jgi:hypothetical protein
MKTAILMMPGASSASGPALAKPAPISPPISACEELEGIPKYQVTRFHAIAPTSAPQITASSTKCGPMIPEPMVAATFGENT